MRIARIKFSAGSHKLYDYKCLDKKINEGDVVFVEGKEEPFYVYEIEEVDDTKSKATKSVLKKAKENPNVTLASRFMNITDCKCECIVNSLGPNTSVFGNICNAIVNRAKSKEIEKMLIENPIANIYDTFITDAGNLPSKHIIHIVMPFKEDDKNNQNLKLAFKKIINLAIENKFESIAIPFIGTGANGYEKEDVHKALDDVMFYFQYQPNIKINIVSINFNSSAIHERAISEEKNRQRERFCLYPHKDYMISPNLRNGYYDDYSFEFDIEENPLLQLKALYKMIEDNYRNEDEFDILEWVSNVSMIRPLDFFMSYRKAKGYRETEAVKDVFGYVKNGDKLRYDNVIGDIRKGKRTFSKYEVYRISIAYKWNFTQVIQFMNLCGYSFSAISDYNIDFIFFNYMLEHNGFSDGADPYEYFYGQCEEINNIINGDADLVFAK